MGCNARGLVERNTVERIYVYPNTSMAMLNIESSVHWVDVALTTADGNATNDARAIAHESCSKQLADSDAENTDDYSGELT